MSAASDNGLGGVSVYLSLCRLSLEELCVLAAVWGQETRVQKYSPVGNGLQRGRAFVGKPQTYKNLKHTPNH